MIRGWTVVGLMGLMACADPEAGISPQSQNRCVDKVEHTVSGASTSPARDDRRPCSCATAPARARAPP
ncbi:hypothetical protein ACN28S_43460 [Cystobacter fuscus]